MLPFSLNLIFKCFDYLSNKISFVWVRGFFWHAEKFLVAYPSKKFLQARNSYYVLKSKDMKNIPQFRVQSDCLFQG